MSAIPATISRQAVATERVVGLDLLRGICAIAVAVYHLLYWTDAAQLYTWGTYGVYIFFVLSGASMVVAYRAKIERGYPLSKFLALRLVRLAPLYILAMAYVLTNKALRGGGVSTEHIGHAFLNLAFQFGLGNPGATSRVTGGWSLGIEFVFYLLFPVFLSLLCGKRWAWVLALCFVSQHVYIATVMANGKTADENWIAYTQFLSFAFYFAAGCVIGREVQEGRLRPHALAFPVMVAAVVAIGLSSTKTPEDCMTGLPGMVLSLLAALAVAASAGLRFGPGGYWVAETLGKASYGVYILHPLLMNPVGWVTKALKLGTPVQIAATVLASIGLALLLHHLVELPIQGYFKRRVARHNRA